MECYSLMAAGGNDLLLALWMQQSGAEAAAQALHSVCMFSPLHECVYAVVPFSFFFLRVPDATLHSQSSLYFLL